MFKLARLVFESLESKVGVKVYFSGSYVNNNHYKTSCNRIPFLQNNSNEFKIIFWSSCLFLFRKNFDYIITKVINVNLVLLNRITSNFSSPRKKWFVNIIFAHCHLNASFKQNNIFTKEKKKTNIFFVRLISKRRALLMKKLYPSVASKLP